MLGSGSMKRMGLVEASVLLGMTMNSDGRLRSKCIIGRGGHESILKGDNVRGKFRKMVNLRVQAKSCILVREQEILVSRDQQREDVEYGSHLRLADIDAHLPCAMLSVPIYDRIPEIRFLKHCTLVEDQIPIDRVYPRVGGHPILMKSRSTWLSHDVRVLDDTHLL